MGQNNSIVNESEYPLPSIPGNIEERLQKRPMNHSRSNSKLRGLQKPSRVYNGRKKSHRQNSMLCENKVYSKDYPDSIIHNDEMLRMQLDIPNKNFKSGIKK